MKKTSEASARPAVRPHYRRTTATLAGLLTAVGVAAVDLGLEQSPGARLAAAHAQVTAAPLESPCAGDCNGNGATTIEELLTLVNIALSAAPVAECPNGDANGSSSISIDELVAAVVRALAGCGQTGEPRIALRPALGLPGDPVAATGSGFAGSTCGVRFHLVSAAGPEIGFAALEADGSFTANLFIPDNATSGAAAVVARGLDFAGELCGEPSGEEARATFTVTTSPYLIRFKTRAFIPPAELQLDAIRQQRGGGAGDTVHFLLQFEQMPGAAEQQALAAAGFMLTVYVTGNAYIASSTVGNLDALRQIPGVRFAGPLQATDKTGLDLAAGTVGSWAQTPDGRVALTVQFHSDVSAEQAEATVRRLGGELVGAAPNVPSVTALFPVTQVGAIARDDAVQYVDATAPPLEDQNDGARPAANVQPLAAAPYNLTGNGVNVLVYDSGQVDPHVDFGTRIIQNDGSNIRDHSTHVAGSVGGSGANSTGLDSANNPNGGAVNQWAGMAPQCNLRSFGSAGSTDTLYDSAGDLNADFTTALGAMGGTDLATMSLGNNTGSNCFPCGQLGDYTNTAILIDNVVRGTINGQQLIYFESAGNERNAGRPAMCTLAACAATGFSSISSPATAKNSVVVGAINSNGNSMTTFSSFGPTDDGRLKPDIVGPGCQSSGDFGITSPSFDDLDPDGAGPMRPNGNLDAGEVRNAYVVKCGTSMSTPVAAGATALLVQQWRTTRGANARPLPHTVKAILAHTATDLGNAGPDYQFGFGALNAQAAVDLVRADDSANLIIVDQVSTAATDSYTFNSNGAANVQVTLAWDDPPAARLAAVTLINDLDLRLIDPDGVVYQPFVLNPGSPANVATTGNDARNNVEMIIGTAKAGTWTVTVAGTAVPTGPQQYTLITPSDAVMNRPPVCNAGGPYGFECAVSGMLNGSGSSDPDGDPLSFTWSGPFTGNTASGASPTVAFPAVGDVDVSLAVSDGPATKSCTAMVSVTDTIKPDLPPDKTAECTSPDGTPVDVGTPTDLCDSDVSFTNDAPALFPLGTTPVHWSATDDSNNNRTGTTFITVQDTTPPVLTVSTTPTILWPPDHRLVNVDVTIDVMDACDAMPTVQLLSVVSSEADSGTGPNDEPGDIVGAAIGTDDRHLRLRAEHSPGGLRTYTLTYRATDASGLTADESVVVRVPKSRPELVSRDGTIADGPSTAVGVNTDGRFVVFPSDATNLVDGDDNDVRDVFLRDRANRTTELVSLNDAGEQGNRASHASGRGPAISGDGEIVAFASDATNLVLNDDNDVSDVFVRDRAAASTVRVSVGIGGTDADGASSSPSLSEDGTLVAFQSLASNLVPNDTNGVADVFIFDRVTGTIERPCDGVQGDRAAVTPSLSPDGHFVAFASAATNLVPGDTNGRIDIFVCERSSGTIERVSVDASGVEGNGDSILPAISRDGLVVAFKSVADNLVPNDFNAQVDIFARDRAAGTTERINVSQTGGDADGIPFPPSLSHDGRFVAFGSLATNHVPRDANAVANVFVRDRRDAMTVAVDVNDDGQLGNPGAPDVAPAVTGDGIQIGFVSLASNLVPMDGEATDVFIVCNPFVDTTPAVIPMAAALGAPSPSQTAGLHGGDRASLAERAVVRLLGGDAVESLGLRFVLEGAAPSAPGWGWRVRLQGAAARAAPEMWALRTHPRRAGAD